MCDDVMYDDVIMCLMQCVMCSVVCSVVFSGAIYCAPLGEGGGGGGAIYRALLGGYQ